MFFTCSRKYKFVVRLRIRRFRNARRLLWICQTETTADDSLVGRKLSVPFLHWRRNRIYRNVVPDRKQNSFTTRNEMFTPSRFDPFRRKWKQLFFQIFPEFHEKISEENGEQLLLVWPRDKEKHDCATKCLLDKISRKNNEKNKKKILSREICHGFCATVEKSLL